MIYNVLISAEQQSDSVIHIYTFFLNIIFHYGLSQDIEYRSLCYTVGPCCLSILFFLLFLPFILSCVEDRILVLQPGVRAVPLRWETQVQDTGPQETLQLHVISNSENLPEIAISTPRPSSTQRPASYSAGHPRPNN